MKQFTVNVFVLFFMSIIIWIAINYSYQKKLDSLEKEKINCQQQTLTLADISFIMQKDKALTSVKKGPLYFSARAQKLTVYQWRITVELEGQVEGAADAADLKLDLSENLTVFDLKVGSAFPLYPRKVITADYLLVTGLSSTNNDQIIFGRPNKIFVEFTVQAKGTQQNKKQIRVNKEDTKIYLNGESVLDDNQSVSLIDLR